MGAIFKRELKNYFLNPTGYVFLSLFLLLAGIFFTTGNLLTGNTRYVGFLSSIIFIFLLIVPVLTMRLMSDESRQKTDQLLLTTPVRISGIVLGKFFAALAFFCIGLAVTILYAVIIAVHGELDLMETIGGYLGFILVGGAFISVGLFISGLTENQVVAAISTFAALLVMWLINFLQQAVPSDLTSGIVFAGLIALMASAWIYSSTRNWIIALATLLLGGLIILLIYLFQKESFVGLIPRFLSWFSLLDRYRSFSSGILSLSDTVYYLSFSAFFLYLSGRTIEKRRWS